jgi:hypothetical protein
MLQSTFEQMKAHTRVLAMPSPELRVHPADEDDDRPNGDPEAEARHDQACAAVQRDAAATASA